MGDKAELPNLGEVVAVRGSVVDVRFDACLPPIRSLLRTGKDREIVVEVQMQQDAHHVRGIALTPTEGLARGMAVEDTGGPLQAPVGKAILSRMFNVFGETIDRGAALTDVQWRSVHRAPPPLAERATTSEVFETGVKAIDVLVPLERGGKAGLFGGAGVGKTVLLYDVRCIDDLHTMLKAAGDWVDLGGADEQKPAKEGTVEAWGRSEHNPVGGWYGLKKGLRGRFGVYIPPLMEALGLCELEHNPKNNRIRAK